MSYNVPPAASSVAAPGARAPSELESQAQATRPGSTRAAAAPQDAGTLSASGGGVQAGTLAPGFASDAQYGSAYERAKVTGGAGGYYDPHEQKYHENLPRESMGDRLGGGLTRPTNLTAGERPHMGTASTGHDDWTTHTYESVAALPREESWWPHWASLPACWYPWNVNAQAYRLGQPWVICLCLLAIDWREHRWAWYVILALTVDYGCRMLAGPRASLITLFGDLVDGILSHCRTRGCPLGLFPRSVVAGAPYQFSDFCCLLILIAATVCFFENDDENDDDSLIAGSVLLALLALSSAIEFFFGFPVFVWLFNQLVHFNVIWKDSEIKSAMMRDEQQRYEVAEQMRTNAAIASMRDDKSTAHPRVIHMNGAGRRSLPYSYRTANEYHKRHEFNPIKNIKVSYFLASATLAALAWVWVEASRSWVFATPDLVWQILIIAAIVLFTLHLVLYLLKLCFFPRHCMWEWEHPIYRMFFLAPLLAWLLFIPSIVYAGYPTLGEVVFWIGAPLLLFVSLLLMAHHYHQLHSLDNFSAAWMMIPLANAIAAYMLPLSHRSYYEAAWLWLGIATFLWIIFSTLTWYKGSFAPRPHNVHRYTLWLMMATAFAICIALVGIYARSSGNNVVGPSTGGRVNAVSAPNGPTLTSRTSWTVVVPSDLASPQVKLPDLTATDSNQYLGIFTTGDHEDLQVTTVGGALPVIEVDDDGDVIGSSTSTSLALGQRDGGFDCTDNTVAGVTNGWRCERRRGRNSDEWSTAGVAAYYIGLVLFLLCLLLTLFGYFGRERWNVLWWVVPLSLCVGSVATLLYDARWDSPTSQGVATTALVLTNIAAALCFGNHLRAFLWGDLYRPSDFLLSPLEFFRLPNKALREVLALMQAHVNNPKATADEWRHFETVLLPRYSLATAAFNYVKRGALYPTLGAWFGSSLYRPLDENARALDDALIRVTEDMRVAQALPVNSPERAASEARFRADFATYVSGATANMDEEEVHLYPLARRYVSAREANAMVRKSWDEVPPSRWAEIVPFIVNFLLSDHLRARWLQCFAHASPEHAQLVGKFLYENLDPFLYERIVIDHPELRPRLTRGYTRMW